MDVDDLARDVRFLHVRRVCKPDALPPRACNRSPALAVPVPVTLDCALDRPCRTKAASTSCPHSATRQALGPPHPCSLISQSGFYTGGFVCNIPAVCNIPV